MKNYLDLGNVPQVIRDLYGVAIFNNDGNSYETLLNIALEYENDGDVYSVTETDDFSIIVTIEDEDNDLVQYVFGYDSKGNLREVFAY